MFGCKSICEAILKAVAGARVVLNEIRDEVRIIRHRLDDLTGRHSPPPMSKRDFYLLIDQEADTPNQKVDIAQTGAVLKTAFQVLGDMPPIEREAMLQELLPASSVAA